MSFDSPYHHGMLGPKQRLTSHVKASGKRPELVRGATMSVVRRSSNALVMGRRVLAQRSACCRPAIPLPRFSCSPKQRWPQVAVCSLSFQTLATSHGSPLPLI
jgi:hypothetical protein